MTTLTTETKANYVGNDRLLFGIILGVLAFWLFAQTTLNIAPTRAAELGVQMSVMNIAVSIAALFSGIFIVVLGGLADRAGRVKIVQWGFVLSIVGSLMVGLAPSGALAATSLILGRLHHAREPGAGESVLGRGRAPARGQFMVHGVVGRLGLRRALRGPGGGNVGWRWIFVGSAAVSVIGMLLVRGTPESRVAASSGYTFDTKGILTFLVAMVAPQVFATQGARLGWTNPASLSLLAVSLVFGAMFVRAEFGNVNAFVDFGLFRNMTYTGATLSNLLLNGVAGILIVAMTLVQVGGGMSAQGAGLLTLGYAIAIVAFIRIGEKLLQRMGPRKPMIWGSLIVGATILLLMPTYVMLGTYNVLAIIAFTLFGIGLAFYATPSTDAALANLPDDQAGAGSGIYKMASSLGASFGVAISAVIFTALSADKAPVNWIAGAITFVGRQDNVAVREAAFFAFGANLLMIVAAIGAIMLTVPNG